MATASTKQPTTTNSNNKMSIYLDAEGLDALNKLHRDLLQRVPGLRITVSDVIRIALIKAAAALEVR